MSTRDVIGWTIGTLAPGTPVLWPAPPTPAGVHYYPVFTGDEHAVDDDRDWDFGPEDFIEPETVDVPIPMVWVEGEALTHKDLDDAISAFNQRLVRVGL